MGIPAPRAPLDEASIRSKISQYWRVSVVELTTSTQSDLSALVNSSEIKSGEVIVSEYQSQGRGRLDRTFQASPESALLFSFYVTPARAHLEWTFISFLAAIALREVISNGLSVEVTLKWPNDILIRDKKVAGIISEASQHGVIIGVGLNVAMTKSQLPVMTATSLAIENSVEIDRNLILAKFLNRFEEIFEQWEEGSDFTATYSKGSSTIGRQVRIEVSGRQPQVGLAAGISAQGALLLSDGSEVNVGDVVHLR